MKPTLCSRCKKNLAVIFITKVENGKTTNEGLCLKCAKEMGYSQIELQVVSENSSAIALYKKTGFVEFGRNPQGFISRYGGPQAVILMYKKLD